ncbi:iron-sulfur cluster assembly accessory protein [Escherichia coli]|nr:iron-sulfur cluster assembly accessory protein [Escherichia coli]
MHIRELAGKAAGYGRRALRREAKTGCAGFGYVLDSVSEPDKDDPLFEHDGAKLLVVPLQAMPFIDGTEVDFVREGLNQIFKFHNPKAQNECGCGESFGGYRRYYVS